MKKVLVATIAFALLTAPAFGAVRNTKHDLSSTSTGGTIKSTNYSETCVFCHTPHGGATGILAPLWNRSVPGGGYVIADLYNSATLEAGSKPSTAGLLGDVNNSDAPLCMSCHDGGTLNGGLLNPANSSGGAQPAGVPAGGVGNNADLGADLTNDHPIGMDYSTVQGTDGELVAQTGAGAAANVGGLPLYVGPSGNEVMWCSSCHDVHDNTNAPFLIAPNAGSALCTTCHVK